MRALVTGANGFIGSHLTQRLLGEGWKVRALLRPTSDMRWIRGLPIEIHRGDVCDTSSLDGATDGIDVVFHLAGLVKAVRPGDFYAANHGGTKCLLDVCENQGKEVRRFILMSSMAAVGPSDNGCPKNEGSPPSPVDDYGKSKLRAEEEAAGRAGRFTVGIARPPVVYGPRDHELFSFFHLLSRGYLLKPAGRDPVISMVYVTDLVEGLLLLATRDYPSGTAFFFSDSQGHHWIDAARTAASVLGVKPTAVPVPAGAIRLFAFINECSARMMGKAAMLTRQKVREILAPGWWCDSSLAETVLGYAPRYDFAAGSRETIDWYRTMGWL